MAFVREFRKFAMRGNITDMAIGFTVGAAFSTIAKSLVNDLLMPPIGLVLGRADFSDLFWLLKEGPDAPAPYATVGDAEAAGAVTLNYGEFINSIVAFLIVALAMFLIIRAIHRVEDRLEDRFAEDKPEADEPDHKKCPYCRSTIPYRACRCPQCTSDLSDDGTPGLSEPPPELRHRASAA